MNEQELISKLTDVYKPFTYGWLPEFSRVDGYFYGEGNQPVVWVELKVRNVTFDQYPDAVVDLAKWLALQSIEEITTIPAVLVYGWSCGTWGIVQPSKVKQYDIEFLTPSLDSVSLNAGVKRKIAKINKTDFETYNG